MNINKTILSISLSLIFSSSFAAGTGSYEVGSNTNASGTDSTAVGNNIGCGNSAATDVTCVGANIGASDKATAIGANVSAGQNATVVGSNSTANNNAISLGYNNFITGGNIGIGNNIDLSSQAVFSSVFFSSIPGFTTTYRSYEMNVGGRTIGGVATATQDDQAVNLGQMNTAISTAISSIPTSSGGSSSTVSQADIDTSAANTLNTAKAYTDQQTSQSLKQANSYTDAKFQESKDYAYAAAALGMASSSVVFNPNLQRQVAVGTSSVHGSNALAVGVAFKSNERVMFNLKGGLAGKGMSGVSAGMTIGF